LLFHKISLIIKILLKYNALILVRQEKNNVYIGKINGKAYLTPILGSVVDMWGVRYLMCVPCFLLQIPPEKCYIVNRELLIWEKHRHYWTTQEALHLSKYGQNFNGKPGVIEIKCSENQRSAKRNRLATEEN